jgi:hypothetical protein
MTDQIIPDFATKKVLLTIPANQSNLFQQSSFLNISQSDEYVQIMEGIDKLKNKPPLSSKIVPLQPTKKMGEILYDSRSNAKILASNVAVLLDPSYKAKLFAQIDYLHDFEDWDSQDRPLQAASFSTFLKTILFIKPTRYPGLGLSYKGNLIAAWTLDKNDLTIEFLANDKLKVVLSKQFDNDQTESSAFECPVSRLLKCLTPWDPEIWFYNAK